MKRAIKHFIQRHTRGFDNSECWNIDYEFIIWLNKRLKVYLKTAGKIVNLEFHKFTYKDKEYTQLELINRMIELSDKLIEDDHYFFEYSDNEAEELLDIFKLTFRILGW